MPIIESQYTADQLAKIPAGPHKFIDAEAVPPILKGTSRVYGLAAIPNGGDQIVRIQGQRDLDRFDLHALWVSGTTLADLIRPATTGV
jgi:hypothetical protein